MFVYPGKEIKGRFLPNRDASHGKIGNANLRTQTYKYVGWPNVFVNRGNL